MDSFLSMATQMAKIAKAVENSNKVAFGSSFASAIQAIAQQAQRMQEVNQSFASLASMKSIGSQMAEILAKQQKQLSGLEALARLSQADLSQLAQSFSKLDVHSKLVEAIQPKSLESLFSFQSSFGDMIARNSQRIEPSALSYGSAYAMALAVSETLPESIPLDNATKEDVDSALNELKNVITDSFDKLTAEGKRSYEAGAFDQLLYTLTAGKISKKNFTIIAFVITLFLECLAFYNDIKDGKQMDRIEKNTIEAIQLEQQNNHETQARYETISNELDNANTKIDALMDVNRENKMAVEELSIKLDSCAATLQSILRIANESKSNQHADEEE